MNCLLAPVPAVHLPDAIKLAKAGGVVAFGSKAYDTLKRLRDIGAVGTTPVYIYVSSTGFDRSDPQQQALKVGKVQFKGTLADIVDANKHGRHPDPAKRPTSTLTDTDSYIFWEVAGLTILDPVLTLAQFSTATGKAYQTAPEGPVEAHLGQSN
ncbi:MAG: hypothetical protein U1E59_07590 [Amaricoccus sp.]